MLHPDLNCDMGEGIGNDEALMRYITSANIACGYHAGDENTIRETILLAQKYHVKTGAHPSFFDRENFGRTELKISPDKVYNLITAQLKIFIEIADECNAKVHHVKPHGALYNMAARDKKIAEAVANATKDADANLVMYGLSKSFLISEAKAIKLKTASEVFADRTYQDNGGLTPRNQQDALIKNTDEAIQQVSRMLKHQKVKTTSGKLIPVIPDTICIHGDGEHAVEFARAINNFITQRGKEE